MGSEPTRVPSLFVIGGAMPRYGASGVRAAFADGTACITIGSMAAGGFGVEAVKTFVTSEESGRWWLITLFAGGLGLVLFGFWLRRVHRHVHVGIVATANDPRRGISQMQRLDRAAEWFSRDSSHVTLRTDSDLAGNSTDPALIDRMADQIHNAVTLAHRLLPNITRLSLIPTMPLHVAFRLGARLGYTHAIEIAVHSVSRSSDSSLYFPAVLLQPVDSKTAPLIVEPLESVPGGDPARAALALDLQNRGAQFRVQVLAACQEQGIGLLLVLRSPTSTLQENMSTFMGVVDQTWRTWRDSPLPVEARAGQHTIFLSGPVAIAVALGARLATADPARWTACTWDSATGRYESMPAGPATLAGDLG